MVYPLDQEAGPRAPRPEPNGQRESSEEPRRRGKRAEVLEQASLIQRLRSSRPNLVFLGYRRHARRLRHGAAPTELGNRILPIRLAIDVLRETDVLGATVILRKASGGNATRTIARTRNPFVT